MRALLCFCILLFVSCIDSNGQWTQKQYGVPDVGLLTDSQLSESLRRTNRDLMASGATVVAGGLLAYLVNRTHPGMSDDPGFFEQLIGDEGMDKIGIGVGLGLFAGGTIGCIVYGVRRGSIKSVINNRNPYSGSVDISPILISNRLTNSSNPGVKITLTF